MKVPDGEVDVSNGAVLLDIDDENNSDCSDDDEDITMPHHSTIDDNLAIPVKAENKPGRNVVLKRLSCKFLPQTDYRIDRPVEISGSTFDKIDEMIAKFPLPPIQIPRAQEAAVPSYSLMSSAALKAVNFGFGSLKRGVDKLGIFSPKK
jgi:hypothetical protein